MGGPGARSQAGSEVGITFSDLCKTRGLSQLPVAARTLVITDLRGGTFSYSDSVTPKRPHLLKTRKVPLDKMAVSP